MTQELLHIGTNGHVLAVSTDTGDELWRTKLASGRLFNSVANQDVCVLEHEGKVFAGCRGFLFCLDGASGEILWRSDLKRMGHRDVSLSVAGKSVQTSSTQGESGVSPMI
ncbi:MAG: PQQ-binding-like beta-propeller repeat protein [Thermoanaerobaculia bacterium]|nr:PQQ-binding-like beta-propeller repeat protein [Thermoanaerobaculia bacterium]